MEAVFLKLLNMSITASYLVLAVVVARLLLKKAPKFFSVILWALVGIRLVCPFSFKSILSLIPSSETVPYDIMYTQTPQIYSGISQVNTAVNNIILPAVTPNATESVNPMQIVVFVASVVWLIGIVAMILYTLISYTRIRIKVREAVIVQGNIYECDHIDTPFILGVIKPCIYLPSAMNELDREYVIAHEKAHLKRGDHLWKPLGFLLLTVYWFNPVLWLAYILLCRDIEFACDEKVIKQMGEESKKSYSEALINCSAPRRMIAACPVAFGETGVKGRIKSVLNYKKPAFWLIITAVALSVVVAVCFMTNPTGKKITDIPDDFVFYSDMFDDVNELTVTTGETQYKIEYKEDIKQIVEQLKKVRVRNDPVSKSRAEDRNKTNSITFEYYTLYFNADFTELWGDDTLKPSFSYKVLNKKTAEKVFDIILKSESNRINTDVTVSNVKSGTYSTISDGYIQFYSNATVGYKTPVIAKYSQFNASDLQSFMEKLENQEWTNDFADRAVPDLYNGRIWYQDNWIYFGYNPKMFFYDNYFVCVDDEIIRIIENQEKNATEYNLDLNTLKEKYPQYFGLDTTKGLEVYVWQMGENNYRCHLLAGRNLAYTNEDIVFAGGATIDEMRLILSSYGIHNGNIEIIPCINPISSYYYEIDEEYEQKIIALFGLGYNTQASVYFYATVLEIYDDNTFLVQPLENEEECEVSDKIEVTAIKVYDNNGKITINTGDKILIAYDGNIINDYHSEISSVYPIRIVDATVGLCK